MTQLSRRTLLKGVVAAGVLSWVAPEIETSAGAQTLPHACCACYEGDPIVHGKPVPGPFLGVAVGNLTDADCQAYCRRVAPKGEKGVVLHFTSTANSFNAAGSSSAQPGCHYEGHWLNRVIVPPGPPDGPGYHSHCPAPSVLQPLGVKCDRAYWTTTTKGA